MDLRRSFVSYAAAVAAIGAANSYLMKLVAGGPMGFLAFPPMSFVPFIALVSGSAWIIAPPEARGWWVIRYGLSAVLAAFLATLATVIFPAIDPTLHEIRDELRLMWDVLLWIMFGAFLWVFWMLFARPYLRKPQG